MRRWTLHTLVLLCFLIKGGEGRNKANRATTKLPAELWFVFFMLTERRPKCLQGCGEFSSSVSCQNIMVERKKKIKGKTNKLVSKAEKMWPAALVTDRRKKAIKKQWEILKSLQY